MAMRASMQRLPSRQHCVLARPTAKIAMSAPLVSSRKHTQMRAVPTAPLSSRALRTASSKSVGSSMRRVTPDDGKTLRDFMQTQASFDMLDAQHEPLSVAVSPKGSFYLETYGCQMNSADSEVVRSILLNSGMNETFSPEESDVVLLNTCSIRENAESKIWARLKQLRKVKAERKSVVGVLGCMAERLKTNLMEEEKCVDVVVGPDAYRDLPNLLAMAGSGQAAVNVALSLEETYADVAPVRTTKSGVTALVSIMRGCDNMCSYCVVPFTRGRERSRDPDSIVAEVRSLAAQGVREVTLLGQNVNSYNYLPPIPSESAVDSDHIKRHRLADTRDAPSSGFRHMAKRRTSPDAVEFADLVERLAAVHPEVRLRFTSPHPKDFPDALLRVIASTPNVCNHIHLPAQSGSSSVLERMRRGYTREAYLDLVAKIRSLIPGVSLSTDMISGFCGETDEDHASTIELMRLVKYDQAFMFKYSQRSRTHAARRYEDDVPEDVKQRRLQEVIDTYHEGASAAVQALVAQAQVHLVLVEGSSKRSASDLSGRNDGNKVVVFPSAEVPEAADMSSYLSAKQHGSVAVPRAGEYVAVRIEDGSAVTLRGTCLFRTKLLSFSAHAGGPIFTPVETKSESVSLGMDTHT